MIQQQVKKIKVVADLVFCIDISEKMAGCISGIKENISIYVKNLENSNPNLIFDLQIGLLGFSSMNFYISDLSKDHNKFIKALEKLRTEASEYTWEALDFCISTFSWRQGAEHFSVLFTEDLLEATHKPRVSSISPDNEWFIYSTIHFHGLLFKIIETNIRVFIFGEIGPFYDAIKPILNCSLTNSYTNNIDFRKLTAALGQKIYPDSAPQIFQQTEIFEPYGKNLKYDISHIRINHL